MEIKRTISLFKQLRKLLLPVLLLVLICSNANAQPPIKSFVVKNGSIFITLSKNMPSADKKITATASSGSSTDAEVMTPELQERLSEMQARRPNLHFDTTEVAAAVARTTTWTATDTIHRELPLAEEEEKL